MNKIKMINDQIIFPIKTTKWTMFQKTSYYERQNKCFCVFRRFSEACKRTSYSRKGIELALSDTF